MTIYRQRLLATSMLISATAIAAPAYAQEVPPSSDPQAQAPTGPVEVQDTPTVSAEGETVSTGNDIIVTGSRIPQPNLTSAAPVTVVSDQDVKLSGTSRIEDVLNQLPSVGAAQTSGVSNGATGTAEVDLRYLGPKRSLVLVNGRRLMPGDPNSTNMSADLNVIPSALIRRAEVLTGGASSVYGADAVAGVVNFIMDTSFEGVRFDGNYSIWQHNQDNPHVANGLHMSDIILARQAIAGEDEFPLPTGSTTDGRQVDGTITIGAGFDDGRGHAVAYFGYRNVKPVLQRDRDYSACVIQNVGGLNVPPGNDPNPRCGGSATANPGTAVLFTGGGGSTIAALAPGAITPGQQNLFNFAPLNYFQRPDERYIAGAFADYEISPAIKPYLEFMFMDDRTFAQIAPSGDFGNTFTINCDNPLMSGSPFNPGNAGNQYSTICGDSDNLIVAYLGNFPVADSAAFNNGLAGTPGPGAAPLQFFDARGNTYNQAFFQLLRRNTEGGPRFADLRHQSWRGVLGTRGDLSNIFSYDAYFQYGRTNYTQVFENEFSVARLNRALNVVNVDAAGAVVPVGTPGSSIVCRSVLDNSDPTCIPYDPFGTAPSAAAVNYLNVFAVMQGVTSEQVGNVNFTGLLGEAGIKTPWAEDGVAINVGVEYRRESLELKPDQSFQAGDLAGSGGATLPVNGNFRVWDVFGEAQIPIIQDQGIEEFTLNLGYRKSWYDLSNGGGYDTDTYKISAEFAPISDVRLRGSYNRAARAPNIQELFGPQNVGLDGSNDPCTGFVIQPTDYGCIAQGLNPDTDGAGPDTGSLISANPAGQYNGLLGGNPNLQPEKGTTTTVGVVLQPSFIPRLALTVDWWDIKLKDAIQGFGADAILAACVSQSTATFTSPACGLVHRDAAGSIWLTGNGYVIDIPSNTSTMKNRGIDVNTSYSHNLFNLGRLGWSFIGTKMLKAEIDNGLSEKYDCVGYYGPTCSGGTVAAGAPIPEWRHKLRTTWTSNFGLGLSLQWRHIGKVKAETLQDNETVGPDGKFLLDPGLRIKAQNYLDLAATYTLWDRVNLRAGVNNLTDNDPPLVTGGNAGRPNSNLCPAGPCNGNTYPGTWDSLGRLLWVGATIDFLPPKPAPAPVVPETVPPPPPPPPATQTCPDGSVILATETCPVPPPPPPPPPPAPERG